MNPDWYEIFWTFPWKKEEGRRVFWSQYSAFNMLLASAKVVVTKVWHQKMGQMTPFLDPLGLSQFFEITFSITPGNADYYDIGIIILV